MPVLGVRVWRRSSRNNIFSQPSRRLFVFVYLHLNSPQMSTFVPKWNCLPGPPPLWLLFVPFGPFGRPLLSARSYPHMLPYWFPKWACKEIFAPSALGDVLQTRPLTLLTWLFSSSSVYQLCFLRELNSRSQFLPTRNGTKKWSFLGAPGWCSH